MEAPPINAGITTWMAQILAHRRLEILQKLAKAFPAVSNEIRKQDTKYTVQPIDFAPLDLPDNLDNS
jgi:hypothetical protein